MAASKEMTHSTALSSDSKERWARHAISKLSKGYKLVVSKTRKAANFHKGFGDFETCPYKTAARLIKEDYVEEVGEDALSTIYELKAEYKEPNTLKKKLAPKVVAKVLDDDDDMDDDDLGDDDLDDVLDDELDDEMDDDMDDDEDRNDLEDEEDD